MNIFVDDNFSRGGGDTGFRLSGGAKPPLDPPQLRERRHTGMLEIWSDVVIQNNIVYLCEPIIFYSINHD